MMNQSTLTKFRLICTASAFAGLALTAGAAIYNVDEASDLPTAPDVIIDGSTINVLADVTVPQDVSSFWGLTFQGDYPIRFTGDVHVGNNRTCTVNNPSLTFEGGTFTGTGNTTFRGSGEIVHRNVTLVATRSFSGDCSVVLDGVSTTSGFTFSNTGGVTVTDTDSSKAMQNWTVSSGTSLAAATQHLDFAFQRNLTLASGSTLDLGINAGDAVTLTIEGDRGGLILNDTVQLNFDLNTPDVAAGTDGNDWINIIANAPTVRNNDGSLILDGILNITAGPNFGAGVYELFSYHHLSADNGLQLGSVPGGGSYTYEITYTTAVGNDGRVQTEDRFGTLRYGGQVLLTVTIPEPASMSLLLFGGLALLRRRR